MADPNISHLLQMNAAAVRAIQLEAAHEQAVQIESEEDINQYLETASFNPMQRIGQFRELHELRSQQSQKKEKIEGEEEILPPDLEATEEVAERYQGNNFELSKKTLLLLRNQILLEDTPEEVLEKVNKIYPDAALSDEALDFLIETAPPELTAKLKEAKALLNEQAKREIIAGRNIGQWAREFSKEGLGSPTYLRDLYRDITGNPRPPINLFHELTEKFHYNQLKPSIDFLLHSLGGDLRAKGSSIPRGELKRLIDEIKSLQGILGVFRFFQSKMPLLQKMFLTENLSMPKGLSFEIIAKAFIRLIAEKFINIEKIQQNTKSFEISEMLAAQILVYSLMREGLKQVAPRYFRNPTHRDELSKAYLLIIEELEDQYEEEKEKKEKKEKKKKDSA
ncbi:MAG TPA: HrpJ domain-containing protein [Chlamydiales bacterium]|nr:MAG: hypothetical protein A3F67_07790 [Verrucomicrobia bacterium RIFCSPHIGHO2_12_FULL_41_10]HLB53255.1 HrpJ domain-containing protein [Chlamydiales bacterium]